MKQVNLHNKVLSSDLCVKLDVSEDTIRRDLHDLANSGKIRKVYGGAMSKSFSQATGKKDVYAQEEKKEIAKKALSLIHDGMLVLLGGGTTILEMTRMLPRNCKCTFFTVSPLVAMELAEFTECEVILLGGQLLHDAYIVVGSMVINQLSDLKTDLCILGTNAISVDDGISDAIWEVVQVKKAMIKSASKTAVVSIAEKLDSSEKMKVCSLNNIDYLITDTDPSEKLLAPYSKMVKVL